MLHDQYVEFQGLWLQRWSNERWMTRSRCGHLKAAEMEWRWKSMQYKKLRLQMCHQHDCGSSLEWWQMPGWKETDGKVLIKYGCRARRLVKLKMRMEEGGVYVQHWRSGCWKKPQLQAKNMPSPSLGNNTVEGKVHTLHWNCWKSSVIQEKPGSRWGKKVFTSKILLKL